MRLLFCLAFIACFAFPSHAQRLEIFAGAGINHFYDKGYDDGHYSSAYMDGLAYCAGVGIYGKPLFPNHQMGLTFKYMEINGGIDIEGGGLGAGFGLNAHAKYRTFELGIFPLNLKREDSRMEIHLGMELAWTYKSIMDGEETSWYMDIDFTTMPPKTFYVNDTVATKTNSEQYFTKFTPIACLKVGYALPIGHGFEITPRLNIGVGLKKRFTEEVDSTPKNTTIMMEICLRKNFPTPSPPPGAPAHPR
ncbi:MAG: hypothetical protein IPM82_06285 [Saprospiraceae bacterium]|nr:hypothetical protein [Saprospiraceae bacterium]